jgi:hypothetical protein
MGTERENWDNEWAGLEPKQPRSNRWGCGLGLVLLTLLLLTICGASGYLAWQRFDLQLGPGLVLVPPTALSMEPDTTEAETPQSPAAELPSLAPTVTLAAAQTSGIIEAGQIAATPMIDGNLDEWASVPYFESRYLVYSVNGWDGTDDVAATWRLGWDSSNLFVAVQVEDNMHVQMQTGNEIFKGDSISLQLDSNLASDFGPELSPDDYQVNLSPGDFDNIAPSAFRFRGNSRGGAVDAPGHGIAVAAQQTEQGYSLEAAIPWQDIGVTPAAGLVIGAAFNVNDNDTPGTAVQEVMKSHIATRTFRDPTSWGSLTLR